MLMIHLKPYSKLLEELGLEIQKVIISECIAVNHYSNRGNYHNLVYSLTGNISIGDTLEQYEGLFEGIKIARILKKRSYLLIVGKALSILFGTITETDLKKKLSEAN